MGPLSHFSPTFLEKNSASTEARNHGNWENWQGASGKGVLPPHSLIWPNLAQADGGGKRGREEREEEEREEEFLKRSLGKPKLAF